MIKISSIVMCPWLWVNFPKYTIYSLTSWTCKSFKPLPIRKWEANSRPGFSSPAGTPLLVCRTQKERGLGHEPQEPTSLPLPDPRGSYRCRCWKPGVPARSTRPLWATGPADWRCSPCQESSLLSGISSTSLPSVTTASGLMMAVMSLSLPTSSSLFLSLET